MRVLVFLLLMNAFVSLNRRGSVIVNYTLSTESDVKGEVVAAVQDLVQGTETISVNGSSVSVTEGAIQTPTDSDSKEAWFMTS